MAAPVKLFQLDLATNEEEAQIDQLRKQVENDLKESTCGDFVEVTSDIRLLRFLRGYKHDVTKAAEAYRDMIRLRNKYGMDKVREDIVAKHIETASIESSADIFPDHSVSESVEKHLPQYVSSNYNVVYYINYSKVDSVKVVHEVEMKDLKTFMLARRACVEIEMNRLSEARGKMVQSVIIADCTGLTISHLRHLWNNKQWKKHIHVMDTELNTTHCEFLGGLYVINLPWFGRAAAAALKIGVRKRTLEKIHFLSGDTKPTLLEVLGEEAYEQMMAFRGDLYEGLDTPSTLPLKRMRLVIPAGKNVEIFFKTSDEEELHWHLDSESSGFLMSIARVEETDAGMNIVDVVTNNVTAGSSNGSFKVEGMKTYLLTLSNRASWIRSKTVKRIVISKEPDDAE